MWEFVQPWLQCHAKSDVKQITDDKFWTAGVTAWYLKPQVSKADTDNFIASGKKMELWLSVWSESAAEIWAIFYVLKEAMVRHNGVRTG